MLSKEDQIACNELIADYALHNADKIKDKCKDKCPSKSLMWLHGVVDGALMMRQTLEAGSIDDFACALPGMFFIAFTMSATNVKSIEEGYGDDDE